MESVYCAVRTVYIYVQSCPPQTQISVQIQSSLPSPGYTLPTMHIMPGNFQVIKFSDPPPRVNTCGAPYCTLPLTFSRSFYFKASKLFRLTLGAMCCHLPFICSTTATKFLVQAFFTTALTGITFGTLVMAGMTSALHISSLSPA
jgi:hypothetical protein